MNRTLSFAFLLGASMIAGTPAFAQDNVPFTGLRAEATIGYDSTRVDDVPAGTPKSVSQARLGAAIGYDIALGARWTLGAELGVGGTLGDGRNFGAGTTRVAVDQGRDFDASVRLGYRLGDSTLLYGKAGWANSQYIARTSVGSATDRESSIENGFRAGGGVEQMLTDRIYAKAEYRYTAYGHDVSRHQLLAGVGIRF